MRISIDELPKRPIPKYNTPKAFADMPLEDIENLIHSCGFYKNKAKNLKLASQKILAEFNGEVPQTMEELMSIPGVGRKTCNVVLSNIYNIPAIAVDTHVERVSKRLKLATINDDVEKIEKKLMKYFPKEKWVRIHHQMVLFGRYICKSKNPICDKCLFKEECKYYKKNVQ